MAMGKALIGGAAYDITEGKTLVDGTPYSIKKGRTLIDGTGYDVGFGVDYDPVFANNDWATIIAVCQAGICPDEWAVGDSKTMTIDGVDYQIDIIGKDHDTYSDGSGTAPLTFQMHDLHNWVYAMNSTNTNVGGWGSSAVRKTNLPEILSKMPSEVQAAIREVNKLTSAGNTSGTIKTTADKLFLLSEIEIFGKITYSKSGEGSQYEYYSAGNSTVKKNTNGNATYWWHRSPRGTVATAFCATNADGIAGYSAATTLWPLSFAFCF